MGELAKTAFEYLFKEEIYIVDDHEIVVKVEDNTDVPVSPNRYLQCRRCGRQGDSVRDFKGYGCHDCDCCYCDV